MNNFLLDKFQGTLLGAIISQQIIPQKKSLFNWQNCSQELIINLIKEDKISEKNWQFF